MKQLFILLISLGILSSCNQLKKTENQEQIIVKRKTDLMLENLEKKYTNYKENQIVRESMQNDLDKKIDSVYKLNFLDDIPVKVFRMGKNPHGKGALIQFHTDNFDTDNRNLLSDRLNFDIVGFMTEEKASKLKEDGTYLISGRMLKRLDKTEVFLIVPQVYYSPGTEISKDVIYDEIFNYNIGDLLMEIDHAKPVKK
ncbi:hypothetical protein [Flavobacterium frigoris]|uniref:Lipoprotein n=1 Tax=Flavobacterium frigoris (strain PS1) TaxID=1086011 RepID=H7FRN4_FLAFP|nr:hypothetical protein [Flavobacterium frigoris]EIA09017.1 hypothetical protein HJ01_01783 [Flavobacterium frigoris PS1]